MEKEFGKRLNAIQLSVVMPQPVNEDWMPNQTSKQCLNCSPGKYACTTVQQMTAHHTSNLLEPLDKERMLAGHWLEGAE